MVSDETDNMTSLAFFIFLFTVFAHLNVSGTFANLNFLHCHRVISVTASNVRGTMSIVGNFCVGNDNEDFKTLFEASIAQGIHLIILHPYISSVSMIFVSCQSSACQDTLSVSCP